MRWVVRVSKTQLQTLLATLGVQVYYHHTTTKDVVNLPFIIYFDSGISSYYADNQNYEDYDNFTIIIHASSRNETLEGQLETLLKNNHIPYELQSIDWDEDLLMWTTQYNI